MLEQAVGAFGSAGAGQRDAAAQALAQQPGAGDVVGMHMRLQRPGQPQAEFADQGRVTPRLLEDRVDQQGLAAGAVGEQVGVGRRRGVEQLAKDEHGPIIAIGSVRAQAAQTRRLLQSAATPP